MQTVEKIFEARASRTHEIAQMRTGFEGIFQETS